MHTLSEENYLKCIYRLWQDKGVKITPTAIAEALGNNPASVVDMIRKLTDKQLIIYDKKKGVELTAAGPKRCGANCAPPPPLGSFFVRKTGLSLG
jgi:DtxR family Mn-dependent transcriptional regulator